MVAKGSSPSSSSYRDTRQPKTTTSTLILPAKSSMQCPGILLIGDHIHPHVLQTGLLVLHYNATTHRHCKHSSRLSAPGELAQFQMFWKGSSSNVFFCCCCCCCCVVVDAPPKAPNPVSKIGAGKAVPPQTS